MRRRLHNSFSSFSSFIGKTTTTMHSLPNELLLCVVKHLNARSLACTMYVCRSWAATGTDVLCASGPLGEWLRGVDAPELYTGKV
jgi:hypothetical protein